MLFRIFVRKDTFRYFCDQQAKLLKTMIFTTHTLSPNNYFEFPLANDYYILTEYPKSHQTYIDRIAHEDRSL